MSASTRVNARRIADSLGRADRDAPSSASISAPASAWTITGTGASFGFSVMTYTQ